MEHYNMLVNGIMFACLSAAFLYGAVRYFKKKKPLFNQLIVCGIGCMMMSRFFNVITILTNESIYDGFTVGKLGFIGGFLFLFSASFGQMDGLVDGREKALQKYRVAALAAPLVIAAMDIPMWLGDVSLEVKIVTTVILISFAGCSYFNLKHSIIPDVELGIIDSIRGYNLIALLIALFSAAEVVSTGLEMKTITSVTVGILCVLYLAVIPVMERGAKKWTI